VSVGERLKKLRTDAKKTLKDESEIFGVSLNSIYRWEHNLCAPRRTVLKKVAEFYGVAFEWLLHGGDSEKDPSATPDSIIDQKILRMIKRLSEQNKYRIIGYIERMSVEEGCGD